MGIFGFEKDKKEREEVREYMVILDSNGNTVGIFNPLNKRIPLSIFVKAFSAKGIRAEIRTRTESPVEIVL